jgi:hypothetical protein
VLHLLLNLTMALTMALKIRRHRDITAFGLVSLEGRCRWTEEKLMTANAAGCAMQKSGLSRMWIYTYISKYFNISMEIHT